MAAMMIASRTILLVAVATSQACLADEPDATPERLDRHAHARATRIASVDPQTAESWLRAELRPGELLEQVRVTRLVESGHVLIEGVAASPEDVRLLVFDENRQERTRAELMRLESDAHRARHGYLSHELHTVIESSDPDQLINTVFYLNVRLADPEVPENPPPGMTFESWHMSYRTEKLAKIGLS